MKRTHILWKNTISVSSWCWDMFYIVLCKEMFWVVDYSFVHVYDENQFYIKFQELYTLPILWSAVWNSVLLSPTTEGQILVTIQVTLQIRQWFLATHLRLGGDQSAVNVYAGFWICINPGQGSESIKYEPNYCCSEKDICLKKGCTNKWSVKETAPWQKGDRELSYRRTKMKRTSSRPIKFGEQSPKYALGSYFQVTDPKILLCKIQSLHEK